MPNVLLGNAGILTRKCCMDKFTTKKFLVKNSIYNESILNHNHELFSFIFPGFQKSRFIFVFKSAV